MLRSLTESRRLPGPPYVIDEHLVEYVVSFAHGIKARIVRVEIPPHPTRRDVLARLGDALEFPDHFGANWDAWTDCLGDLLEVAEGGTVVILDRSERLLAAPPTLFAEFVHHLQQCQDTVASTVGDRCLLEFVFSGRWAVAEAQTRSAPWQAVFPAGMDDYDWSLTEAKGWIDITVRPAEGEGEGGKTITFYDPIRLAQEIRSALTGPGYFAESSIVVVPAVTREAITAAVARMD